MCRLMHIIILEYQQLWKEKRKSENHQNTNECAPIIRVFHAPMWAHIFRAIFHQYVYSSSFTTSPPPPSPCLSPPISPHLPQCASLLQHCSLTGWGSVLSHQQQNCRSLSGPAIYPVVFSTRVITVLLTPSPQATGPAGHRWCDTISRDICSLSLGHNSKWPIWLVAPE